MTLSHIKRKNNNNQTSLQHIGNLAYHQGKSATSYDCINSLTKQNNHYTLLYPALVQELFNSSLHKSNSTTNISHFFSDLDIQKSSSLDSSLSPRDILFFLQIVSLYQLELNKGNSSITYPSLKLAKILGVDISCDNACDTFCDSTGFGSNIINSSHSFSASNMRATILKMTAKLESLGLLKVFRRKKNNGMDKANKLVPVLPDILYNNIKDSPANLKISDSSKLDHESNLDHILRTKLFVPIELEFMKSLFKNNLPSKYKLFFLNCIMSAYRNFRQSSSSREDKDVHSSFYDSQGNFIDLTNKLSFSTTSRELIKKNNISKRTLFNIFKYIKQQDSNFFLKVEHKYTRTDDIDCNRYDKSIFVISINPLVFLISQIRKSQEKEIPNINHDKLQGINSSTFSDTYQGFKEGVQKKQPISAKKAALNNKEIIIKNKNIDYIDDNSKNSSVSFSSISLASKENHKEEFLEDNPGLSSSKSYNNNSFFNNSCKQVSLRKKTNHEETKDKSAKKEEQTEEWQELRQFYPLSSNDVDTLNFRAGREFSVNFANQLLLKLYIKYPEKRFKNKFTFISYMVQILAKEKHQGPLVNHTSFRFSCNINAEEKNLLKYEKYLSEIENSLNTSKEMQVKKKIVGRFSTNVACSILQQVEFKTNHDNSFVTALIPSSITLSERQIKILSKQLEAVYGINGYYVQEVEDVEDFEKEQERRGKEKEMEILYPKITKSTIVSNSTPVGILERSGGLDAIEENTAWHQIRSGLIEELGYEIDKAWFSKARVKEDKEMKTLILSMPTKFMADWLKNQYGHIVYRLSSSLGFKFIEYYY
uniref:DnaA-like replication initiator protein n=1 Tax=Rickettsia monacensis TaxID=109232 RepID=A6MYW0_9RICK|nr:DnaA N-terminal domain-containing protein [Rickettsia monacensis]ABQ85884.1 DnaA-like replication initiator protein [Rickettsia monacensis]